MNWLEAVFLGLLQGVTEFLPISSSAHLRIAGEFLPSGQDPGAAFTAITQIGTELAVLVYFRHDIWNILQAWFAQVFGRQNYDRAAANMGWLILLGSLPIIVLGLLFKDLIETSLRNLYITATALIVFGLLLGYAERIGRQALDLRGMRLRDGLLFGLAQAMALIPGVSRSGGTITAGLLMGYTREAAARYSFLLAVPAVFGSGFYQLFKSLGENNPVGPIETGLATLVAFVTGYGVIVLFLRLVSTKGYSVFVWYRVALGLLLLTLLATGTLSAI